MSVLYPFVQWLADVRYNKPGYFLLLNSDAAERPYLQVAWIGPDAVTGEEGSHHGRKWWLSQHMTKSEFVQTCLMAVLAVEEHEARELFLYKERPVFGPHYNVDALVAVCEAGAIDVRA